MKHSEVMNKAKIAVAGVGLMTEVIDKVAARRSDIVEDVLEKVLGVKHDAGDDAFNAAMNKRAESVTAFNEYEDRVAALEAALDEIRTLSQTPLSNAGKAMQTTRYDITAICRKVLK